VTNTWEEDKGRFWAEHADHFSRQLAGFLPAVLDGARLQPGDRVIDIGSGGGDLSIAAGRAVGPEGSVVGVDLSADEVAVAVQRVADAGLDHVTFEVGDAGAVQLSPPFDVLVSRFGVMFFTDPVATFTHLHSLLVDTGRLSFVAWTRYEDNPWLTIPMDAIASVAELAPLPVSGTPGPYGLAEETDVRQVLGDAGFSDIALDRVTADVDYGDDIDRAAAFIRQMDLARATLDHQPEEIQAAAVDAVRATFDAHRGSDGLRFPGNVWRVTAHA